MRKKWIFVRHEKHWRDCLVCGGPVYIQSRTTCSAQCAKEYRNNINRFSKWKKKKEEIKKKEKKIRRLEEKLKKKLYRKIFLPFKKPKDWPLCRKCGTIVYVIGDKYYCDNCNKFVEKVKIKKMWRKVGKLIFYYCLGCKKTRAKHYARGYCYSCYQRLFRKKLQKKWSKKYDKCIKCGTTKTRHHGKGLCNNCYIQTFERDIGKRNKYSKDFYKNHKKEIRERQREYYKKNKEKILKRRKEKLK